MRHKPTARSVRALPLPAQAELYFEHNQATATPARPRPGPRLGAQWRFHNDWQSALSAWIDTLP